MSGCSRHRARNCALFWLANYNWSQVMLICWILETNETLKQFFESLRPLWLNLKYGNYSGHNIWLPEYGGWSITLLFLPVTEQPMIRPCRRTPRYHLGPIRLIFTSSKPAFSNHCRMSTLKQVHSSQAVVVIAYFQGVPPYLILTAVCREISMLKQAESSR